jgi:hypothetical protein
MLDIEFWRKTEGGNAETLKEISIVDREGGQRTVDMVERDKVLKHRQSR